MIGRVFGALVVGFMSGALTFGLGLVVVALVVSGDGLASLGPSLLGVFITIGAGVGVGLTMTIVAYRALGTPETTAPPAARPLSLKPLGEQPDRVVNR